MKQQIRKYTPRGLYALMKKAFNIMYATVAYRYDRRRFLRYYARGGNTDSRVNVEAQVIFSTHQIEKGLSHVDFRDGFGKDALKDLRYGLERLSNHTSTTYIAALSAVKSYLDVHEDRQYDLSSQKDILGKKIVDEAYRCDSDVSGYLTISKARKRDNREKNF